MFFLFAAKTISTNIKMFRFVWSARCISEGTPWTLNRKTFSMRRLGSGVLTIAKPSLYLLILIQTVWVVSLSSDCFSYKLVCLRSHGRRGVSGFFYVDWKWRWALRLFRYVVLGRLAFVRICAFTGCGWRGVFAAERQTRQAGTAHKQPECKRRTLSRCSYCAIGVWLAVGVGVVGLVLRSLEYIRRTSRQRAVS